MMPGALIGISVCGLVAGVVLGPRLPRLWLALTLVATSSCFAAAVQVLAGAEEWQWRSEFLLGGEPIHLRLDGLSALFLVLLNIVGAAGAVYAREYWSERDYAESAPRGRLWWSAMILSMSSVLLSSNGLHFLIAWELFAVSSYFLITLDRGRAAVRAAGWLYLAASHIGTLCLFGFFASLAARTGSWELGPMREQMGLAHLLWLALGGFAVKAGLFPVHIWLPSAHANAPSHVSALMSGVAIKMGIYGLVRFTGWLPAPPAVGWVIIALGSVTALLGIAFALAQNDLKRLLAYCSVENVGIMAIGVGGALLGVTHGGAPWERLLLAAALLHVWNHGLFKALLFFAAGSVLHATGTREMSRLGGLWRSMPWTAGMFALGAAAISGLPPLNGFVSEWMVYLGLFDAATSHGKTAWAAMPAALMLAMASALALATFIKAGAVIFLGAPRTKAAAHAHETGPLMRGAMLALAFGCVSIGLAPVFFWPAIARATGPWNSAWSEMEPAAALVTLSWVHLALAVVFLGAGIWLWRRVHGSAFRRGLTWDCGYSTPTARMQYTSGSFAGLAGGWFGWILHPEQAQRRPRRVFPRRAFLIERVPETVLERVMTPVAAIVMRVSGAARQLQHGRLQFYIVYLAGGIAAIGVIVWLGGAQ
jgi:hydrogenase-4 component B